MADDYQPKLALELLTTTKSDAEAAMIVAALREAGIYANGPDANAPMKGGLTGGPGGGGVLVHAEDLYRAREVLNNPVMSEDELIKAEEEAARG